jgi:hypothetical protein
MQLRTLSTVSKPFGLDAPPDLRALANVDVWGCHQRDKLEHAIRQSGCLFSAAQRDSNQVGQMEQRMLPVFDGDAIHRVGLAPQCPCAACVTTLFPTLSSGNRICTRLSSWTQWLWSEEDNKGGLCFQRDPRRIQAKRASGNEIG